MVAYLAYSRDSAPSDFFLFGYLKCEIAGFTASSAEDILSEIRRIFEKIPKEILTIVYNKWITEHEGEHYHKD
jgi:hypothetical protein